MTTWSTSAPTRVGRPGWPDEGAAAGRVLPFGRWLLDEAILHAYVDNKLSPRRRREIEHFLSRRPRERARIRDFQVQNRCLHAQFDPYFAQPLPPELALLEQSLREVLTRRRGTRIPPRATRALGRILVVIVAAAGIVAFGLVAHGALLVATSSPMIASPILP